MNGAQNGMVDALSHLHANALHVEPNVITDKELATIQENDTEFVPLKSFPSSLILKDVLLPMSDSTIVSDVPTDVPRPYVPPVFRHAVFDSLHSLADPGVRAVQRLVTARFMWPSINFDVRKWTRTCL